MVSSFEVRIAYPSISFLFARLGGSLGVSHSFTHLVGGFVFGSDGLSVALADLLPLPSQSLDWFEGLAIRQGVMSEVRSSELEIGLSSSDDSMEGDTAVSAP